MTKWLPLLALLLVPRLALAACDCGSTDASAPCTGTETGTYTAGSITANWEFTCGGRACRCGQFITGEYWVTPIDDLGVDQGSVTLSAVTTALASPPSPDPSTEGGIEMNPVGDPDDHLATYHLRQSLVPSGSAYSATWNERPNLPLTITPTATVPKVLIAARESEGETVGVPKIAGGGTPHGIVHSTALAVMDSVPAKAGSEMLRPPWAGDSVETKPIVTLDDIRFDILPAHARIDTLENDFSRQPDWTDWATRYRGATYDKCAHIRAFIRICAQNDTFGSSGGDLAGDRNRVLLHLLNTDTVTGDKRTVLMHMLQEGLDRYALMRIGNRIPGGADQTAGRTVNLALLAALVDNNEIQNWIFNMGQEAQDCAVTESPQTWLCGTSRLDVHSHAKFSTRTSAPGGVIASNVRHQGWNGSSLVTSCGRSQYVTIYQSSNGEGDCGDYWGYTDSGPKRGLPEQYQACCWMSPMFVEVMLQRAFPQMHIGFNYPHMHTLVDRYRGTLDSSSFQGTWNHGPCSSNMSGVDDTNCNITSGVDDIDDRFGASDHAQLMVNSQVTYDSETAGGFGGPTLFPIFRECADTPATAGCEDWVAPFNGDGVCDANGLYSTPAESNSNAPADCQLANFCGDGVVNVGEDCDDLGPVFIDALDTCQEAGPYTGGTLGCSSCAFDFSSCTGQTFTVGVDADVTSGASPLAVTLTATTTNPSPTFTWECDGDADFNDTCTSNPTTNSCVCPTLTTGTYSLGVRESGSTPTDATVGVSVTDGPTVASLDWMAETSAPDCDPSDADNSAIQAQITDMGNNITIDRRDYPCQQCFGIQANANAQTVSVGFFHTPPGSSESAEVCENTAPYSFSMEPGGSCTAVFNTDGEHTVRVVPYDAANCGAGAGNAGSNFTRTFTLASTGIGDGSNQAVSDALEYLQMDPSDPITPQFIVACQRLRVGLPLH